MKIFQHLQVLGVSLSGISGIELIDYILKYKPALQFAGQSIIGILTIIYLIKKILKK